MILAFDVATCTGWCAGEGSELPVIGHVNMPAGENKDDIAFPLDFWDRTITRLLDEWDPGRVIFEAPVLPPPYLCPKTNKVKMRTNIYTARKLYSMASMLEVACLRREIPCVECDNQHVKKLLGGHGRAPKVDMVHVAKKCGLAPKVHDEADAFGVWLLGIHYYAKEHQPYWDKRLYSGIGLL